ncbi:unnamed protein product [Linum tenue]|uniref:mitogen-activated protein kinase n=1 Tax=Linum tenue TaxID=586396 RepID=A0AAV0RNZ0_9ROSI|nr:unnamed protein product [Linum tenue]
MENEELLVLQEQEEAAAVVAEAGARESSVTHGGRYVEYKLLGNIFHVSSKYVPPVHLVGRGSYGVVCCARNAETNEEVAIKKIGNAFDNSVDAKRTLCEIKLLRHMDHENVI